jgi:hypothetical protein
MCFFSPLIPCFNFKACYLQSERISLNQNWDSIPQYLMLKIQNNYGNSKHSNSKGTHEKIKMMKLKYTKFCDNLNFIPHLNAMCFSLFFFPNLTPSWSNSKFWYCVSFTSQISLFSSRLYSLYSKSNVSISFLGIWFCRSINLSMKEGSLFCSYEIHWTRMLQIMFMVSLESSWQEGVHGGSMKFGLAVQKFLNIEWFLHWKIN